MWELEHKPWAYEYHVDPAPLPEMSCHDKEGEEGGLGWFLLAFLCAIIDLPEIEESGIEGTLKLETPQSKTGKS